MKFTRLRLNGFKSFVDPTDLTIADGLTGVVGPNGCGKSNLLEALRWVMGENRASAMRGGGMDDVIFAGTDQRGARNFAEVTLSLDNSTRLAPQAFNTNDHLEVIRRITRDTGSAYKLNGKDVRARDVQMLFADASTGAHSPALVRQGQIVELINAKPQKRRRILEEAAGIAGLYQRRHEAELRLSASESNLQRLDDVLEQLSNQLASLARQAKQAQRYRTIGAALRQAEGRLLFRGWQEAAATLLTVQDNHRNAAQENAQLERKLQNARQNREAAEAALPRLREEDNIAAAVLQRLLVARDTLDTEAHHAVETIKSLESRLQSLSQDTQRETALNTDAKSALAQLQDEADRLRQHLEGQEQALNKASQAAHEAEAALAQEEHSLALETEHMAQMSARHADVKQRFEAADRNRALLQREGVDLQKSLKEADNTVNAAQTELAQHTQHQEHAQLLLDQTEDRLRDAETARAECQAEEDAARKIRVAIESRVTTLESEITSLAELMAQEADANTPILDTLTVSPGYEAALGAALADDLRAPLTEDQTGWVHLGNYSTPPALPDGIPSIEKYVQGGAVLRRRLQQIGIVDPDKAPLIQEQLLPGQRLVSLEGSLWRWDGFRMAAKDNTSASAMRLKQMNRLQEMRDALQKTETDAEKIVRTHETLTARLKGLSAAETNAREARRKADHALVNANHALSHTQTLLFKAQAEQENINLAITRNTQHIAEADEIYQEIDHARAKLPSLEKAQHNLAHRREVVQQARQNVMSAQATLNNLERDGKARMGRLASNAREQQNWRQRLATAGERLDTITRTQDDLTATFKSAREKPSKITAKREVLGQEIAQAERRRAAASDALSKGEAILAEAAAAERALERTAADARAQNAAIEVKHASAKEALEAARANILQEQGVPPEDLLDHLSDNPDQIPDVSTLETEIVRLKRQRDALGAVNLRAEEDAQAISTEQESLTAEKSDLEDAIQTLRQAIFSLNREGRERLVTAFETVNKNFALLFTHLFGGGEANLMMVESDDPLEAGLEILCQPPGKKLSTLSLLSGGEQTLTALALIFAVFLANPAPICVLDEVDAPLDDANVGRFCDLLDEMTRRTDTRFLIITHHAITMARMDRLFGVTMAERGVSQLVSVDLKRAEALVT